MTGTATAKAVTMRVSASAKTKRDAIAEQRRKTVDEYGWLTAKLSGVRADLARLTDLAKVIREWGGESPADKNVTFVGNRFSCHLGPCGLESKIKSMDAVYESLGHEKFIKACSVTLKALEAAGGNVAALTVKRATGTRPLTVTRRK